MSRYIVVINVEPEDLKVSAAESAGDEIEKMSESHMVWQEFGWLGQSGIHVETIQELEEYKKEISDDISNASCCLWEDDLKGTSDCIRIDDLDQILRRYGL